MLLDLDETLGTNCLMNFPPDLHLAAARHGDDEPDHHSHSGKSVLRPSWLKAVALLALCFCCGFAAATSATADWPQYRGPHAGGVDDRVALPYDELRGEWRQLDQPFPLILKRASPAEKDR